MNQLEYRAANYRTALAAIVVLVGLWVWQHRTPISIEIINNVDTCCETEELICPVIPDSSEEVAAPVAPTATEPDSQETTIMGVPIFKEAPAPEAEIVERETIIGKETVDIAVVGADPSKPKKEYVFAEIPVIGGGPTIVAVSDPDPVDPEVEVGETDNPDPVVTPTPIAKPPVPTVATPEGEISWVFAILILTIMGFAIAGARNKMVK